MKTILVLTDFSIRADHAARYALKLAQKMKANLLLCNVFLIPSSTGMASQVAWPMENYETLEEDSVNDLSELVSRLNNELNVDVLFNGGFRATIEHCSKAGLVWDTISEIALSHQVVMVVIGMHGGNGLSTFLSGDHAKDVIEKANCPVLLVPNQAPFKDYQKIAFATDLADTDINVLHSLAGLAKFYNAEILITHVADESITDQAAEPAVKTFLSMVSSKINYPKIYYRAIKGKSVANSLDWLSQHIDIDLLVLVHRKRGFFQRMFEGSVTQNLADHLTKPLLVFPASTTQGTLPVF
jgi:nucleotide-binding universal stress UspA family protein